MSVMETLLTYGPFLNADDARDAAIDWSHEVGQVDMSWGEVAEVGEFFSALAERFPELEDEFRENGII